MARKKTGRNAKSFSEAVGFRNKYHSDTTDFFLGLFLLALTVYVLIQDRPTKARWSKCALAKS